MTVITCRDCEKQTWVSDGAARVLMDEEGRGPTFVCPDCRRVRANPDGPLAEARAVTTPDDEEVSDARR